MADKNLAFDALRLALLCESKDDKKAVAVILRQLVPLIRDNAMMAPAQGALLAVSVYEIAQSRRRATSFELCTLAAFANSCQ